MMSEIAGMISVIVPTCNRADFLKKALRSIILQNYPQIEIIVVANGCSDETENVVEGIKDQQEGRLPEIVFLNFKHAIGGAKARNIGMDHARGEYIAFLDDDDIWHADKLNTQIELLNQHQCAIVSTNLFCLYGDEKLYQPSANLMQGDIRAQDLYCENILGGFSLCITKKSYIGEHRIDEELAALQDWDLWLKILTKSQLTARISTARHVYFRIDGARLSTDYPEVIRSQQLFLKNWKEQLGERSGNYHHMRTRCYQIKLQKQNKLPSYVLNIGRTIKAIFQSSEKWRIKRYIQYLLLPLLDLTTMRIRLSGKSTPLKNK